MAVQYKRTRKRSSKSKGSSLSPISLLLIGVIVIVYYYSIHISYIILGATVLLIIYAIISGCRKPVEQDIASISDSSNKNTANTSILNSCNSNVLPNEDPRKVQCDSFCIDDMQQFSDIPFLWSYVTELQHTNGVPWFMLNWNNQKIAKNYISIINDIIIDSQEYIPSIGDCHIDLDKLDFDYPDQTFNVQMCCTRVECYPYTATGKLSKYPVVLPFATKFDSSGIRTIGEIKILRDGNIGAATVSVNGNTFKIGLHGKSLVLKRVDNSYMGGNLFKFSEMYE